MTLSFQSFQQFSMITFQHLSYGISLLVLVFLFIQIHVIDAACEGTVTFYWKENPSERKSNKRNWGKLEEEIISTKSKLSSFIDIENTYAYKVNGDCCWELFNKIFFQGESQVLSPQLTSGFAGIKGFPTYKAYSLKKMEC